MTPAVPGGTRPSYLAAPLPARRRSAPPQPSPRTAPPLHPSSSAQSRTRRYQLRIQFLGPTKAQHPPLTSSPSPPPPASGPPCNHSKMPGVAQKPQPTIHPSKRRRLEHLGAKPILAFPVSGAQAGGGGGAGARCRCSVAVGPALRGCRGDRACSVSEEAAREADLARSLVSLHE